MTFIPLQMIGDLYHPNKVAVFHIEEHKPRSRSPQKNHPLPKISQHKHNKGAINKTMNITNRLESAAAKKAALV